MTVDELDGDDRRARALAELRALIEARYPEAEFSVRPGIDDSSESWLVARVDADDPDEVLDLVLDRLLELQIDEGVPVFVLPLRTPQRTARLRELMAEQRHEVSSLPEIRAIGA